MNDVEESIKHVQKNEISVVSLAKELLKDGKEQIKVVLERNKIMPERMESPPREHIFHDVAGFGAFLAANKTNNTVVFADVNSVSIVAVLDDQAGRGFETVSLSPPYHPEFQLLDDSLLNKKMAIETFAQGVMRNRKIIKDTPACDANSLAMAMQQLTVATGIVQAIGDGKTSVNGVMTTTSITTGGPEAKERLDLPDSITVEVPIYLKTEAVTFDIDLTISTKSEAVIVVTDSPELELKKYEVFETMMEGIRKSKKITVVYGCPRESSWKYNS